MHNAATSIYPIDLADHPADTIARTAKIDALDAKYGTPEAIDTASDNLLSKWAADDIEAALATRGQGDDERPIGTGGVMVATAFAAASLLAITFSVAFGW